MWLASASIASSFACFASSCMPDQMHPHALMVHRHDGSRERLPFCHGSKRLLPRTNSVGKYLLTSI
jgi:hypothetical protein